MVNIIVVFSSQKDGINIRNLLMRHGHNVVTVCTNGAAVSQAVDQMEGSDGIVVSGYKYQDMTYSDLLADLPDTWQMIVMASQGNLSHIFEYNVIKIPIYNIAGHRDNHHTPTQEAQREAEGAFIR